MLAISALLLTISMAKGTITQHCSRYDFKSSSSLYYSSSGDIIFGGILQMSTNHFPMIFKFSRKPSVAECFAMSFEYYYHLWVFMFAVEKINADAVILPNISLGYEIYGLCNSVKTSGMKTLSILSGKGKTIANYNCWKHEIVAGFIGALSSTSSYSMAEILGIYRYPQISYGSTSITFNSKIQFPSFYQTTPNEFSEINVIAQLLKHFGFKWVGIIISDDDAGHRASEVLTKSINNFGGCVAFTNVIAFDHMQESSWKHKFFLKIRQSTAFVIVVFLSAIYIGFFVNIFLANALPKKVWIVSSFFMSISEFRFGAMKYTFNGTLSIAVYQGEIPGFKEFLFKVNPSKYPEDDCLADIWEKLFMCFLPKQKNSTLRNKYKFPKCTGNESLENMDLFFYDVFNFRIPYRVYTAVYALAHALHDMHLYQSVYNTSRKNNFKQWMFNTFVRNVHFSADSRDEFYFDSKGNPPARFDIIKWIFFNNENFVKITVGRFNQSAHGGIQLELYNTTNLWDPYFPRQPVSVCSASCVPGYRTAKREGHLPCCYDCVRCTEGEISNTTDARSCLKCPKHQWENERRNACIPKNIQFLSFDETLGKFLTSTALFLSLTASAVLLLFIKFRNIPIVKANNRYISCVLLVCIVLSFLSTLLFIGRPTEISCMLRQSVFGIVFSVAVSCVLAKTITVVIAFKATKPNSKLRNWLGSRVSNSLVLVCSLGEIVICAVWMVHFPPFLDEDTQSESGKIILQCNEGSVSLFFSMVGYIAILALFSFVIAFLAKDFPDTFNEAKNITFSMLLFCSVWISFVPAYLSTKGRKSVAVEIFAILVSGAGLLGCIFFPKCYIIFIRPEKNKQRIILQKLNNSNIKYLKDNPL